MTFRLRSGKTGLELRLHQLEATIMDVVWQRQMERFPVADVVTILSRERDIAYTTVMTTIVRLRAKGLLERTRDGKRYLYSATLSREQFLESTAREVLRQAVGSARAIAMLAERVSEANSGELEELELLIRKRRLELDE